MRHAIVGIGLLLVLGFLALSSTSVIQFQSTVAPIALEQGAEVLTKEYISKKLTIDRIYGSMTGPYDKFTAQLEEGGTPEAVWIKNIDFIVLDADGKEEASGKNFCHGQFFFDDMQEFSAVNEQRFHRSRTLPRKVFTGIQGQLDLPLPEGFGFPLYTDEKFELVTMAFNLEPDIEPFDMRIKTRISYVRDKDTNGQMRALGKSAIDITLPLSEDTFETEGTHSAYFVKMDEEFSTGRHASKQANLRNIGNDLKGTNHFYVTPGRHEYKYQLMGTDIVPFNTTVHMMVGHLHPYGELVEITDLTTNELLFTSYALQNPNFYYVQNMTSYSSSEGIAFYLDHEYEYRAVYNNTSDKDIDAMAVLYFYFYDKAFEREMVVDAT